MTVGEFRKFFEGYPDEGIVLGDPAALARQVPHVTAPGSGHWHPIEPVCLYVVPPGQPAPLYECSACRRVGPAHEFERCADGVLICPPCEEPATLRVSPA